MNVVYHRFAPARPLRQYRGQPGIEVGGLALSPAALDALATSISDPSVPCELVVIGEYVREDGARWLDFATPTAYIEAVTDYRDSAGLLRLWCEECESWDGKHLRSCDRR